MPAISAQDAALLYRSDRASERPACRADHAVADADRAMDVYRDPRPSRLVMGLTKWVIRHVGFVGIWGLRTLGRLFKSLEWARGMRIVGTDLPNADGERLTRAVNDDTAAFLSPNHPEFFTDITLDWHVGSMASSRLAFWAAWDVVNLGPLRHLFIRHNLISNAKGGDGRGYSRRAALNGDGVLLHPEGDVSWTSDVVHPLFPGVGTLPVQTARYARAHDDDRPVYVVPMVWKLEFTEDVSEGLNHEMDVLERRLLLPSGERLDVGDRFFALLKNVLRHREEHYGLHLGPISDDAYFERNEALAEHILAHWEHRLGLEPARELGLAGRTLRLRRAARPLRDSDPAAYAEAKRDYFELRRARHNSWRVYNRPRLTQEHMAETLKRFRQDLVKDTLIELIRTWLPFAVGPRVVHVRVAEPIEVGQRLGAPDEDSALAHAIKDETRAAMQSLLDDVNQERGAAMDRFAVDNPFYRAELVEAGKGRDARRAA